MSKRPCSIDGCKTQISGHNRSGICVWHKHQIVLDRRHKCEDCGVTLSASAVGYVCRDCITARAKAKIRHCAECNTRIDFGNISGLCQRHYNEKRGMRSRPRSVSSGKPFTVRQLVRAASVLTGISEADIAGPRRFRTLVSVRRAIVFAAKPFYSAPEIGRVLGGRDHSSIFHALEQGEAMKDDWKFKAMQERLKKEATVIAKIERSRVLEQIERLAA